MAKKRKKKRGFPVFYTIYWTLVIVALGAIAYGLVYLYNLCADYEAVQPKYAAAEYLAVYEQNDIAKMIELTGGIPLNAGETTADYEKYVRGVLEGRELSCGPAYSSDDDVKRYVAKADGIVYSEFTLRKTGEKSKFGFDQWAYEGMTMDVAAPEVTYTAKVFSDYTVYVNGEALPDSCVTESGIATFSTGHLPSNVYNPTFKVYTFSMRFGAPTVTAKNENGEEGALIADEGSASSWHMDFVYSDALHDKMHDYVMQAAKAYALFISEDGSRTAALKYVLKGSQMENYINAYDNSWFTPHSRYTITNAVSYDYLPYADNCFSCNVQYVFNIFSSAGKQAKYPTAFRFYFGRVNDNWLLFDYEIIDFDMELYRSTED